MAGFFGGGGDATVRITTHMDDTAARALDRLKAKTVGLGSKMMTLGSRIRSTGQSMTIGLTVPIIALGAAITKTFTGFDDKMAQIVALSDASAESVAKWRDEILKLAPEVAKSPQELADALFFLASAGLKAGTEMDVLKLAATASAIGLGDTDTIAKALTNTMLAYGQSNVDAAQLVGILTVAVKKGSLEADELAGELGRLLPLAVQLDISFAELTATMATLSLINSNASENASVFVAIMNALVKASPQGEKVLKSVGMSYASIRKAIKDDGLIAALREVDDAFGDGGETLEAKVFPRIRGLIGFLTLTTLEASQVDEIFREIAGASAQDVAQAFEDIQTPGFQLRQAMVEMQVIMVKLGATVVPILVTVFQTLVTVAKKAADIWVSMPAGVQKMIVIFAILLATMGPLLIAFGALIATAGVFMTIAPGIGAAVTIATGPWGLLALAILAVIATIVAIIVWWDDIVAAMDKVIQKLDELLSWFESLAGIGPILSWLRRLVTKTVGFMIEDFQALMDEGGVVTDFFQNTFTGQWAGAWINIQNIARSAVNLVLREFNRIGSAYIETINLFIRGMNLIPGVNIGQLPPSKGFGFLGPVSAAAAGVNLAEQLSARIDAILADRDKVTRGFEDDFAGTIPRAIDESTGAVKALKEELEELEEQVALTAQEIVSKLGGAASLVAKGFSISLETVNELLLGTAAQAGFALETLETAFREIVRTLELTGQAAQRLWNDLVAASKDAAIRTAAEITSALGGAIKTIADEFDVPLTRLEDALFDLAVQAGFAARDITAAFTNIISTLGLGFEQVLFLIRQLNDEADETASIFERVMDAVAGIVSREEQAFIDAVAAAVEAGMGLFAAILQVMRDIAEAELLAAVEAQILALLGAAVTVADFVGLTLQEIQALLDELAANQVFQPQGNTATTATVPLSFGANVSSLVINMGGVVIQGGGVESDAVALTDAVEQEMRSRRLRGF